MIASRINTEAFPDSWREPTKAELLHSLLNQLPLHADDKVYTEQIINTIKNLFPLGTQHHNIL